MTDTTTNPAGNTVDDDDDTDAAKTKADRTKPKSKKDDKPKADEQPKSKPSTVDDDEEPKSEKKDDKTKVDDDEPVRVMSAGGGLSFEEADTIEQLYVKVLLYGDAGCGKTHAAVTAGKRVLVITAEPQSVATVKRAAPKARVARFKRSDNTMVNAPPSWEHFQSFLKAVTAGEAGDFDVLVFDGLHELLALLSADVLKSKALKHASKYALGQQGYGELKQRSLLVLRFIRDLKCHVVVTMGAEHKKDDESNVEITGPLMEGGAKAQIAYMFNAVAYMYRTGLGDDDRMCMVDGPNTYVCRATRPLRGVIRPDVAKWIEALMTGDEEIANSLIVEGGKTPDAWRASKTAGSAPSIGNTIDDDE